MPFRFQRPPDGAVAEPVVLRTDDLRDVPAIWWTPRGARPKVAVVAMHPKVDFTRHYTFQRLLAAGVGCLGARSRCEGDDTDCVHEDLLLDVAACVAWLKAARDVRHVVLLGNSGGGSLSAFYQAQAVLLPSERLARTPGGRPTALPTATMPPADGLILVAAHRGQGRVLLHAIDPAVVDEADPLATDPSLDLFAPENGFRPPPTWSAYRPAFLARYRDAQRARVARLDGHARALIARRDDPRARDLDPVMVVYRTMANPSYVSQDLDPSPRDYGSLISDRPDRANLGRLGFARTVTPEAWLSTWSGLSSRADLVANLPSVHVPTLIVHAARDRDIFPATDHAPISAALGAPDAMTRTLDARHYFEPEDPFATERPDVDALMDVIVPWIGERFGEARTGRRAAVLAAARALPGRALDWVRGRAGRDAVDRHPLARHWRFPPADRPPLQGGVRRTNLRSLAARPARFEHHLTVVGRIGAAQLEVTTASEPLPLAHANLSDEYALSLPTGDPLLERPTFLTLLSIVPVDPLADAWTEAGGDVGRIKHRAGDLVLHAHGLLHWPGRLRPPFDPPRFPPGLKRCGLGLVFCANEEVPPHPDRPLGVPPDRQDAVKAYADNVPFFLEDVRRGPPGTLARVGEVGLALVVRPAAIDAPRGAYVVVIEGEAPHFDGDLLWIPPGGRLDGAGLRRVLVASSERTDADPPPEAWERPPQSPMAPFEDGAPGALPLTLGPLHFVAEDDHQVRVEAAGRVAHLPRHWAARLLFRLPLHGFRLGYAETYGGLFWDDRDGASRLGVRGLDALDLPPADRLPTVDALYRALAPPHYRER